MHTRIRKQPQRYPRKRIAELSIKRHFSVDCCVVDIMLAGRFDHRAYDDFRALYTSTDPEQVTYRVDLQQVSALDSAGLGLLILLREYAGNDSNRVHLVNVPAFVMEILNIACLENLFALKAIKAAA